ADLAWTAGMPAQDAEGMRMRCLAMALLGRGANALQVCEDAVRRDPQNAEGLRLRGYVQLRLGRLDAALADYEAALRPVPHVPPGLYGRAMVRQRRGDTAGAAADIAAARLIEPLGERRAIWMWLDYDPQSEAPPPDVRPLTSPPTAA